MTIDASLQKALEWRVPGYETVRNSMRTWYSKLFPSYTINAKYKINNKQSTYIIG